MKLLGAACAFACASVAAQANDSTAQDCGRYRTELQSMTGGPAREAGIRLRLARCLGAAGAIDAAAVEYRAVAGSGPLSKSPALLDEASAYFVAHSIPLEGTFDTALELAPTRDTDRRNAIARVLVVLTKHPDATRAARAADRLWLDYPDIFAALSLVTTPVGQARAVRATREDAIRRARALLEVPDPPAALTVLQAYLPPAPDVSLSACEIRVVLARAQRRTGQSSDALVVARLAATRCPAPAAAEAAYLVVMLLSGREEDPAREVEDFVRRFPQDSRADDVLLQRAQLLGRSPDPKRSVPVLETMLKRYPDGDMAREARFLLAFEHAREGHVAGARRLFDEDARLAPPGDVADRAAYWSARLRLYPRLDRLERTTDGAASAGASADLARLASSRFGSYYALLARLLLHGPAKRWPRADVPANASVPLPARLAQDAEFVDARALLASGYAPEAQLVLDQIVDRLGTLSDIERLQLASAYQVSAAAARGYHLLSPAGGRSIVVPPGPTEHGAPAAWVLLFPELFKHELDGAATAAGIPTELMRAIAREESTFDSEAMSPTGAVGLCQIQSPAAKEASAILRRAVPTREELRDPTLNAVIGATYLRRRLDTLPHPLLAIAAYNRGPTSIAALARKLGAIPIDTFVERIPAKETRDYVKRVAGSWDAYAALDAPAGGPAFPIVLPRK